MSFLSTLQQQRANLSVSAKLNLAIIGIFVVVFAGGSIWLSSTLSSRLERTGTNNLISSNQRVLEMVDAYASALESSADLLGKQFAQQANTALAGDFKNQVAQDQLVESFTRATQGVATIFTREGDEFVRTATTLKNAEGQRATGSQLKHEHPGYAAILAGKNYIGRATLFSREYMTHYVPIKDGAGNTQGIAFIGVDFTESLAALKKNIREIKIGETGYVYILDKEAKAGTAVVHPSAEGQNLIDTKSADGRLFIQEMLKTGSGVTHYSSSVSANQGPQSREKIAAYGSFERWHWLVASGSFKDEFTRDARFVSTTLAIAGLLITLIIGICVYVETDRLLARPLNEVVEVFNRIAKGELNVSVREGGKDEIGQMLSACKHMCSELKSIVQRIHSGMDSIEQEAENLMGTADNVAIGSQEQSDGSSSLAASIEELSVGIEQMSGHSHETRKVVEDSSNISDHGVVVISSAVSAMSNIAETVRISSEVVSNLGAKTEEIIKVVTVIREIADQTNLLALNAAIEAARAGEQGRGFAVVADEVRKLAERTTTSTQEIARTIELITSGAQDAVQSMTKGVQQVTEGVELASKAGDCIKEMRNGSEHVGEAVIGISESLREQSAASEHIASTVEQIATLADNNREQARGMAESSRRMYEIAHSAQQTVAWFKL